jgi:hypothetical protein
MAPRIVALVEETRAGVALAPAIIEIDEVVSLHINGAVLYYRRIAVEQIKPEWEVEIEWYGGTRRP